MESRGTGRERRPHRCEVAKPGLLGTPTATLVIAAVTLISAATTAVAATTTATVVVTTSVGALVRVLEPRDRIPTFVVRADAGDTRGSATGRGATCTGMDSERLSTGLLLLRGIINFGKLETRAGIREGGHRNLEDLSLKLELVTKTVDEIGRAHV